MTTCCSKHRPGTCAFVPGCGRRRREEVRACAQGKLPGPTTVKVRVTGLTPGLHGFHLEDMNSASTLGMQGED
ncbi:uncharacterized protein A4U43_C05F22740 [Asparagus officinalis]|uniref:Superoxide dismutase copper/zinc binding domain-containing protein n=1 Tax=Asparagus officinalis TaxID=4686 RepID=A0A5P1EV31_ASPOF|nr:uncharacterized protein A4U43_C05F22740 [Asparagus officinalis]